MSKFCSGRCSSHPREIKKILLTMAWPVYSAIKKSLNVAINQTANDLISAALRFRHCPSGNPPRASAPIATRLISLTG